MCLKAYILYLLVLHQHTQLIDIYHSDYQYLEVNFIQFVFYPVRFEIANEKYKN